MALIDFHTHILPGIDDGSSSLEESIAMLRMTGEQGIRNVIATPHFYPQYDSLEHFLQRRDNAFATLCEKTGEMSELPTVILGAEVYFFRGMSQSDSLDRLTIGEKKCILLEMPAISWTDEIYRELYEIHAQRGIVPIIAHVERYITPFNQGKVMRQLAELPVLVQANANFFVKRSTARMAARLLKEDRIHLLGSDCHNMVQRKPNLDLAVQRIRTSLGDDSLCRIEQHQAELLEMY